ncbi:hypothetical protein LX36DRAFT_651727 [Colletotrichum falcatum]|nr:hypothetical protein LX36DRAFT_651727 [Colletotrichum falcatum]
MQAAPPPSASTSSSSYLEVGFSVARSNATASPHRRAGRRTADGGGRGWAGRDVGKRSPSWWLSGFVGLLAHLLLHPPFFPNFSYVPRSGPPLKNPVHY